MSTQTNTTMKKDKVCSVCPFIDEFQKFIDYYGDSNYADKVRPFQADPWIGG